MKIVHVPYTWRPHPFGGTEHYVLGLWRALKEQGVDGFIAACPAATRIEAGDEPECHGLGDQNLTPVSFRNEQYGGGSAAFAEALADLVEREDGAVVHFHARNRLASSRAGARLAERGIPYIYTFHTPTTVCRRGDLRFEGSGPCDGRMDAQRCSACWLRSRGVLWPVSQILSSLDLPVAASALGSVLGARRLTESLSTSVRSFLRGAAGVVALCDWGREVLLRNGVNPERIVLSRHGLDEALIASGRAARVGLVESPMAEFVFVGRADRLKGADLLLEAVRRLPSLPLRVVLFLVVQGLKDESLVEQLKRSSAADSRVRFEMETPREQVLVALSRATACVVPSRWLETGPLVVLESFAAGTPVIGTRIGGIAELVRDEENGILFDLEDVDGLARALHRLVEDEALRGRLRRGVSEPRSMKAVAVEMEMLYKSVLRD